MKITASSFKFPIRHERFGIRLIAAGVLSMAAFFSGMESSAQMVAGKAIPNFNETMGTDKNETRPYSCQFISSTAPGNILWPGEQAEFTFQLVNNSDQPIKAEGKVELISYATKGRPGDIWVPDMFRTGIHGSTPINVDIAPGKFRNITVKPVVPSKFGPYALIVDIDGIGRRFLTSFVRTFKAESAVVRYPQLAVDVTDVNVITRLGAFPNRAGISYQVTTDAGFGKSFEEQCKVLEGYKNARLPITVEFGVGAAEGPTQPLERVRPHLDEKDVMLPTKADWSWLPSYDADFKKLVKMVLEKYGWPRGTVIAVKFMNEPWEGLSISGWGGDMPRYREIFTALCEATAEARKEYGVEVLIGGCDSSGNTIDKLFGDGKEDFLKYLDFCSVHYQGMNPPTTVKSWLNRKSPNGRVLIWDTESWVANTDDRVAAVVATNLSTGHDRAVGVYRGNICTEWDSTGAEIFGDDGKKKRINVIHTWSVAASVAATSNFIGQRKFKELLFKNGLPWVMVFDGMPDASGKANPEDGTIVVVGDIGEEFGHDNILFSNARGFKEIENKPVLKAKLAALPKNAPAQERESVERTIRHETLSGASMTLLDNGGKYLLFDFYGNPVTADNGKIVVPLDGRGFFLRGDGKEGSFAALLDSLRTSRVDGIEPLAKKLHDILSPVDKDGSSFRLELTNVLNRPVKGKLTVSVKNLKVESPAIDLSVGPNETKTLAFKVSGKPSPDNTYPFSMLFDAGSDGKSIHEEELHVNQIARRTINVDGKLDDWNGVLPQTVKGDGETGPTMTEQAWLPFEKFDKTGGKGFANGYLAYDDKYFYFAAKIADSTPDGGTLRFETRDDEQFYYPEISYRVEQDSLNKVDTVWTEDAGFNKMALQKADKPDSRILSGWENGASNSFGIDISIGDSKPRKLALYLVAPDSKRYGQNIQIVEQETGKVLDSRQVNRVEDGSYLLYEISGKIRIVVKTGGWWYRAAVSGIFLDPSESKLTGNAAKFISADEKTTGNWIGKYGSEAFETNGAGRRESASVKITFPDTLKKIAIKWPEGVRRYSYRKNPVLPAGNAPRFDNVQIAFNVLDQDKKPWAMNPPGTMPGYIGYKDTDYEYALNKVSDKFGGGTEIWRLEVPGMPHKHFYPRQGESPFDGPVKDGKLVVVQDSTTRIVECAIPWSEIPDVKKKLDAGETIKFSFRVNDDKDAGCLELSKGRSIAKRNGSFHVDWAEHWANELEFGFEK